MAIYRQLSRGSFSLFNSMFHDLLKISNAISNWMSGNMLPKFEILRRLAVERSPNRRPVKIWVAGLGELRPVLAHGYGQVLIFVPVLPIGRV